jgi:hypothetical protein
MQKLNAYSTHMTVQKSKYHSTEPSFFFICKCGTTKLYNRHKYNSITANTPHKKKVDNASGYILDYDIDWVFCHTFYYKVCYHEMNDFTIILTMYVYMCVLVKKKKKCIYFIGL